jgi:uncharacterized protein
MDRMSRCPICGKQATPRQKNAAFPFCGPRCKQIDLGKWLDEGYRVPTDEPPQSLGEEPHTPREAEEGDGSRRSKEEIP